MEWQDRMPWSLFFEHWVLSQVFIILFHFHQEALWLLFAFCHKGDVISISEVIGISPCNLDSSWCFIQMAFHMMYSAYNLNKQGNNIQPWYTPFPVWNQSIVPCPVLCCFLTCIEISEEAGKWSDIPISLRIFHSLLWSTQSKVLASLVEQKLMTFFCNSLAFLWSNGCWKFDLWFLCIFWVQVEPLEVLSTCTVEASPGEFWALLY